MVVVSLGLILSLITTLSLPFDVDFYVDHCVAVNVDADIHVYVHFDFDCGL